MNKFQIIALVIGACLVTFIISVIFAINMVSIKPRDLAKVIKKDPGTFIDAVREASQTHLKKSQEKKLEEQLKNPAEIATKGRVTFGDPKASITIVEYSDFQCPYCASMSKRLKGVVKKYEGKVNVVYKHFPLSFHPFAQPAAEYFEAIALVDHEQAKKFHDAIFDNFSDYARLKDENKIQKSLQALVKKLKLDNKAIKDNMEKAKQMVTQDMEEAGKLNVTGTPSVFVNGIKTSREHSIEFVINRLLKDKKI